MPIPQHPSEPSTVGRDRAAAIIRRWMSGGTLTDLEAFVVRQWCAFNMAQQLASAPAVRP